jgi:hypothetical protein
MSRLLAELLPRPQAHRWLWQVVSGFLLIVLTSCPASHPTTTASRSFRMGTIYWVPLQAPDSLIRQGVAHTLAVSDILTAQIPWKPTDTTFVQQVKWMADLAHMHQRRLIVNMDWLADSRQSLRGTGWHFAQPGVQQLFTRTALQVCQRYHPAYLNLGVETNFYALTDPADFRAFLRVYHATKQLINQHYPATKVSVSLQVELLMGLHTSWSQQSSLEVLRAFNDDFDLLALSTYPHSNTRGFGNLTSLRTILSLSGKPFGIFETSVPTNLLTPTQQQTYLQQLLPYLADTHRCMLLVWTSTADTPATTQQSWVGYLGLYQANFTPKPAAGTWNTWYQRPYLGLPTTR